MILHTVARCIADPPCEWTGTTDKSAEKHTRETGHATVSVTIPAAGRGTLIRSESSPASVCAPTGPGPIPDLAGEDVAPMIATPSPDRKPPACTCPDDDKRACPVHDLGGQPPREACQCLITDHNPDCPWVSGEMAVDMEAAFPGLDLDDLAVRIVAWVLARVDAEMADLRENEAS